MAEEEEEEEAANMALPRMALEAVLVASTMAMAEEEEEEDLMAVRLMSIIVITRRIMDLEGNTMTLQEAIMVMDEEEEERVARSGRDPDRAREVNHDLIRTAEVPQDRRAMVSLLEYL